MTGPRVLVAPDKFKGSLDATGVAAAVARGIRSGRDDAEVVRLPVADGGDGTLAAATASGFERVPVRVSGPTAEPVDTAFARRGRTAVVEMADACGLGRLPGGVPDPLGASSRGLGEVIAAALAAGCRELVVGIGGSASTDGGAGMLGALGARLLDGEDRPVGDGGGALSDVARLDLSGLHPGLAEARIVVACDVDNPLTGDHGAAAVYAPQKGATPDQVRALDAALAQWADVVAAARAEVEEVAHPRSGAEVEEVAHPRSGAEVEEVAQRPSRDRSQTPGAGAAGGVGFAAVSVLGASLEPGIGLMLDLLDFDDAVTGCDLVVTGEGALDEQSLHGKAPIGVATRAREHGIPVVAVCGRRLLSAGRLREAGIGSAYALSDVEPDLDRCVRDPAPLLELLGRRIADRHL